MNRAPRPRALFHDDIDCVAFLEELGDVSEGLGAQIQGYALLPDRFHLMVEVPRGNLAAIMRHIGTQTAIHHNRRHNTEGSVFRGRYLDRVHESDAHWPYLLAHLHCLPAQARFVSHPDHALWTSHSAYLDPAARPDWLNTAPLLAHFGSPDAVRRAVHGVWTKSIQPPADLDPKQPFVAMEGNRRSAPRRTQEQALCDVATLLDVAPSTLTERPRGPIPNAAPWLYVWWLLQSTGMSQAAVAAQLGIGRSRVSQLRKAMLDLAMEEPTWRARMNQLEASP